VDSGVGTKFNEKYREIYAIDYSEHSLLSSLARVNIQPEDVTDLVITHLHFDHVGGATYRDNNDQLQLQFPNAIHYVQKKQLEWARRGFPKDRASYLGENIEPLVNSKQLKILDGPHLLAPDLKLILSEGHSVAQQMLLISGQNETLLYAADLIPLTAHLPVPWVMAYDLNPVVTIQEKEEILKQAVDENWLLFFEHDPRNYCGTVEMGDRGYQLGKSVQF
jgi:glyoxylase-like metal-dependent hydrolase (beta-lactamase superfamily II)